jgi:ubiquinone biosynthesis monooxygenase Coq7
MLDRLIVEFDKGLRTVVAQSHSRRVHPDAAIAESALESADKRQIGALMRINHCGEVCAQALYNGQSFTSRNPATVAALQQASAEETEHLAWCERRIAELGGRKSMLNPLWYAGSFLLGSTAGALGDKWNLGFLAETERQVGQHLKSHLDQLPEQDNKSRAILEQMYADETHHAETAVQHGGADLPKPVKTLMALMSKVMTRTTYYL